MPDMNPKDAAAWEQTWERAKDDTRKLIADCAIMLQADVNPAFVAAQFAKMGMASPLASTASTMAVLLVMCAQQELKDRGLSRELPPDPFTAEPTDLERVEQFVNELTALCLRHNLLADPQGESVLPLVGDPGAGFGTVGRDPVAVGLTWDTDKGRFTCQSPDLTMQGNETVPLWVVPS